MVRNASFVYSLGIIHCQVVPSPLSNIPYRCVMQSVVEMESQCGPFDTNAIQNPVAYVAGWLSF